MTQKVYFIQMGRTGPIKIGQSGNPMLRMDSLQTANPAKLRLLWVYEGEEYTESRLHEIFIKDKIRGEWFKPTTDLLSFIKTTLSNDYQINLPNGDSINVFDFFGGEIRIATNNHNIILNSESISITREAGSSVKIDNLYPWAISDRVKTLPIVKVK